MFIPLDRNGKTTLVLQIRNGIAKLISSGDLPRGTRLPSTRDLATALHVNRNTVVAAYELLCQDGLATSQVGQGTIVTGSAPSKPKEPKELTFQWGERFGLNPQAGVQFSIPIVPPSFPKPYMLLNNYPDPTLFSEPIIKSIARLTRRRAIPAIGFKNVAGYPPLIEELARRLTLEGVDMSGRSIVLTPGATIANNLVLSLIVNPGESVVIERPTHFGILRFLSWGGCRLLEVSMKQDGMDLDALKSTLQNSNAKLIYTIPTAHNPTGVTTSEAHRRELLAIANKYRVPILEDDYLFGLHIGGPKPPSLSALDTTGIVITTSSFSKVLWQGLRLGFLCAPKRVATQIENLHRIVIGLPMFVSQMAVHQYIESGLFDKSVTSLRKLLTERQRAFLESSKKQFGGSNVKVWDKACGPTVYIETPGKSGDELAAKAASMGVLVASGSYFLAEQSGAQSIRVSLTDETPERIKEATEILAKALESPLRTHFDGL